MLLMSIGEQKKAAAAEVRRRGSNGSNNVWRHPCLVFSPVACRSVMEERRANRRCWLRAEAFGSYNRGLWIDRISSVCANYLKLQAKNTPEAASRFGPLSKVKKRKPSAKAREEP